MELKFDWNITKATTNLKKHGISFEEAKTVFDDPFSVTISDPDHSFDEERFIDIGMSIRERLLIVVYTERGTSIRLISCRKVTAWERTIYAEQTD